VIAIEWFAIGVVVGAVVASVLWLVWIYRAIEP
jgi:hypothetical protein